MASHSSYRSSNVEAKKRQGEFVNEGKPASAPLRNFKPCHPFGLASQSSSSSLSSNVAAASTAATAAATTTTTASTSSSPLLTSSPMSSLVSSTKQDSAAAAVFPLKAVSSHITHLSGVSPTKDASIFMAAALTQIATELLSKARANGIEGGEGSEEATAADPVSSDGSSSSSKQRVIINPKMVFQTLQDVPHLKEMLLRGKAAMAAKGQERHKRKRTIRANSNSSNIPGITAKPVHSTAGMLQQQASQSSSSSSSSFSAEATREGGKRRIHIIEEGRVENEKNGENKRRKMEEDDDDEDEEEREEEEGTPIGNDVMSIKRRRRRINSSSSSRGSSSLRPLLGLPPHAPSSASTAISSSSSSSSFSSNRASTCSMNVGSAGASGIWCHHLLSQQQQI